MVQYKILQRPLVTQGKQPLSQTASFSRARTHSKGLISDTQRRQAESQGLARLFPPGELGSEFAGRGSMTNR